MTVTNDVAESETPLSVSTYRYPTGWYIVANSSDVSAGTLRPCTTSVASSSASGASPARWLS